eukprot:350792-Chlamydomonas_euryale.AAC.4
MYRSAGSWWRCAVGWPGKGRPAGRGGPAAATPWCGRHSAGLAMPALLNDASWPSACIRERRSPRGLISLGQVASGLPQLRRGGTGRAVAAYLLVSESLVSRPSGGGR